MKQNELYQLWEVIKPISSDPVIQQRLWEILLKIIENERYQVNQISDTQE